MNNKKKLYTFLLLLPIIDLITSITEKIYPSFPSLGIIIKSTFLGIMILYLIIQSTSKYKKMSLYYLFAIFIYANLFLITKLDNISFNNFYIELKHLIKLLFYPISLVTMVCYFDDKKFSKEELSNVLLKIMLIYLVFLIIPLFTQTGFNSYIDGSYGTSGWYYAANELAIILICLFPFTYNLLKKNYIFVFLPILSAILISTLGTKVSMIGLYILSSIIFIISIFYKKNKKLNFKLIFSTFLVLFSVVILFNNSNTIDNLNNIISIQEIQNKKEYEELLNNNIVSKKDSFITNLIDKYGKAILSDRDIYFKAAYNVYRNNLNVNTFLFGIGYSDNINNKFGTKLIEIDVFDIFFHSGIVLLIIVLLPFIYYLIKLFKSKKINIYTIFYTLMLALIFSISCLSGHTFGAPAVSIYLVIYMLFAFNEIDLLSKKDDKIIDKVTIYALHLGVGGVENNICTKANMLSKIYNVEIISLYKLYNKPFFNLNNNIKVKYLTKLKPNKEEFRKALRSKNIKNILNEGFHALKVLYLKNTLITKSMINCNSKIIISTRVDFSLKLVKNNEYNSIKVAEEHIYHNNNKKYLKKLKYILKYIDYLMPSSNYLTDYYKNIFNDYNNKIIINNMPIETNGKVSKLTSKNIISVGRLSKEKRFDDLIRIFSKLDNKDWTLTIVGDGEEMSHLNNIINDLDLSKRVILTGYKNSNQLNELYENSSLYIMTSFEESFGLVLVEAASHGLPLIAFDSAIGAKEIIKNNGILIENRDENKMINEINKLIKDNNYRNSFQKKSLMIYSNFKYDKIEKYNIEFYENIKKNNLFSTLYIGNKKECYDLISNNLNNKKKTFIITANPEIYMQCKNNKEIKSIIYNTNNLIVPDGISIVKKAKKYNIDIKERITGVDISEFLLNEANKNKNSIYLFGAKEEVISKLIEKIKSNYPNINILGYSDGYVKNKDKVMKEIINKKPDICMIALGVPNQELLINKYIDKVDKGIYIGVGGTFDVLSGYKKRAPQIFIKLNLEWLYRIICEPKRMGRFIKNNIVFMFKK